MGKWIDTIARAARRIRYRNMIIVFPELDRYCFHDWDANTYKCCWYSLGCTGTTRDEITYYETPEELARAFSGKASRFKVVNLDTDGARYYRRPKD